MKNFTKIVTVFCLLIVCQSYSMDEKSAVEAKETRVDNVQDLATDDERPSFSELRMNDRKREYERIFKEFIRALEKSSVSKEYKERSSDIMESYHRRGYRFLFTHDPQLLKEVPVRKEAPEKFLELYKPKTVVYLLSKRGKIEGFVISWNHLNPPLLKRDSVNQWLYYVQPKQSDDLANIKLSRSRQKIYELVYKALLSFGIEPESVNVIIRNLNNNAHSGDYTILGENNSRSRTIWIDNYWKFEPLGDDIARLLFTAFHEAAHQYLKSMQKIKAVTKDKEPGVTREQELAADWLAIEHLLELNEYETIFIKLCSTLRAVILEEKDDDSYPSPQRRYDNMVECLKKHKYELVFENAPNKSVIAFSVIKDSKLFATHMMLHSTPDCSVDECMEVYARALRGTHCEVSNV